MGVLVQKYGGTSLSDIHRIQRAANRIKNVYEKGNQVAVILSAMGHSTDDLMQIAHALHSKPKGREIDMLLSTGEQVSIALMAMALDAIGVPAISLIAMQAGIHTFGKHTDARISSIDVKSIQKHLKQKRVCLIAGFQGVKDDHEIYTLGRGGSDTSAVALAVALQANECEIFTDVDGIYSADPNKVSTSKRLPQISYEEMLELARLGAGVLHSRSIELASKNNIALHVRSSFNNSKGSFIVPEEKVLEKALIRGVSLKTDEARLSVFNIDDRPGLAARLFGRLAEASINVDMIVQSTGQDKKNTISFTILQRQIEEAQKITESFIQNEGNGRLNVTPKVAIVSAVGVGMISHSGVAATMFKSLADMDANIEMISTSEIKISVVLHPNQGHQALKAVHDAFGLNKTS